MTYAAVPDLVLRYSERDIMQLTDRAEPPSGLVDVAVATGALVNARDLINGYVAKRYRLPLVNPQPLLKGLNEELAWYYLQNPPTEHARGVYTAAIKLLERISEGAVLLPGEEGVGSPDPVGGTVEMVSEERLFSRSRMRGF